MGKGVLGLKEEAALARTVIKKRLAGQPAPDIWFLIILMLLVCYGLVMLFSAGYAVALYRRGDAYTYIRPQLLFAAFGAAAMYAASLVDYHIWHKRAGHLAAQRDRQVCGSAGVCPHHFPQP